MRIVSSLEDAQPDSPVALTIGSFDGVHRGHQHLLAQLVAAARLEGRSSAVVTFHPHPRVVLHPNNAPTYLSTPEERAELLQRLGIDLLVVLPFTAQLASTPADEFVSQLYGALRMRALWVGPGFALGHGRGGGIPHLRSLAQRMGWKLCVAEPFVERGQVISSSRIRTLLGEGEMRQVASLLGRPYTIAGQVVPGRQRGRILGFRTANLALSPERAVPGDGVYAVWVWFDGERHAGVANIGVRPSFGAGERLLEAHLMDYEGDLYDRHVVVDFVERLRPELHFENAESLVAQIACDVQAARAILSTFSSTTRVPL